MHRGDHATGGLVTAGRRSSSATTSTVNNNNNNSNGASTRSLDVDDDASTGFMTQATRTPAEESARKARAKRRAFLLHAVGHGPPYDTQLPLVRQLSRLPLLSPRPCPSLTLCWTGLVATGVCYQNNAGTHW